MNGHAGVWLDHRKAVIVALTPDGADTTVILSHVEKHPERSGDSPMRGKYEAQQIPADDSRQRALTGELNVYYDSVIAVLRNHASLYLFGPGEAKGELRARLEKKKLAGRVQATETFDNMTDPQIVAKVRKFFQVAEARIT